MKFTPFHIAGLSDNDGEAYIIENDTRTVCWTTSTYDAESDTELVTSEDLELAEFIVAACNREAIRNERWDALSQENQTAFRGIINVLDGTLPFDPHAAICGLRTMFPKHFEAIAAWDKEASNG